MHRSLSGILFVATIAGAQAGCVESRVGTHALTAADVAELDRSAPGRTVTVVASNPLAPTPARVEVIKGRLAAVDLQTLYIVNDQGPHHVPLAHVQELNAISHGAGAGKGALIGALAGVVLGAALGYTTGGCGEQDFCIIDRGGMAALLGVSLGAVGTLGGLVVGAGGGDGPKWQLHPTSPDPADETRPSVHRRPIR